MLYHLPRLPISQVSTGFVASSGSAYSRDELKSPLGGQACIAYQLTIWYLPIAVAQDWCRLPDAHQCVDFLLKDDSSEARIVGLGSELALTHRFTVQPYNHPSDLGHVLEALGYSQGNARRWYIEERLLLQGDPTYVAGVATREPVPGARGGYREQLEDRPVIQLRGEHPLLISNNPIVRETSGY